MRSVGQTPVTESGTETRDSQVTALGAAVRRLRRELAGHPGRFPDREIADRELAALAVLAAAGPTELQRMRRSLLLVAGAIGSVSALGPALMQVRSAVDGFGDPGP